jgi:hypothetical protein
MPTAKRIKKVAPSKRTARRISTADKQKAREEELLRIAGEYAALRRDAKEANKGMTERMPIMVDILQELDRPVEDANLTVVIVEPHPTTLDAQALEKRLGPTMWENVTTRVLDKNKLDAFVKSGEIDPKVVAAVTTTTDGTVYAKVTTK